MLDLPPSTSGPANDENQETTWPSGNVSTEHRKYERRTKRFPWPDELHRLFVAAIFDLGLRNASPKALLPFMEPSATQAGLTTEHLKSHLQKYRLNYDKSRAEFLGYFDESTRRNHGKRRRRGTKTTSSRTKFIFPITLGGPSDDGTEDDTPEDTDAAMALPEAKVNPIQAELQGPGYTPQIYHHPPPAPQPPAPERLDRLQLLRLAQQNAAIAAASALASQNFQSRINALTLSTSGDPFSTGLTPRAMSTTATSGPGAPPPPDLSDPQRNFLAALLSPQVAPVAPSHGPMGEFALDDKPSPDLQMQMHLAMQAQMDLHRQMLHRKVAVSQHYLNPSPGELVTGPSSSTTSGQRQLDQAMLAAAAAAATTAAAHAGAMQRGTVNANTNPYANGIRNGAANSQRRPSVLPMDPGSSSLNAAAAWSQMEMELGLSLDDQGDPFGFLKVSE